MVLGQPTPFPQYQSSVLKGSIVMFCQYMWSGQTQLKKRKRWTVGHLHLIYTPPTPSYSHRYWHTWRVVLEPIMFQKYLGSCGDKEFKDPQQVTCSHVIEFNTTNRPLYQWLWLGFPTSCLHWGNPTTCFRFQSIKYLIRLFGTLVNDVAGQFNC